MKVSDFIVQFLIEKGITDVFGYPGGMVTHLIDSLDTYKGQIRTHVNYHEQASAFSACGYAQASLKPGVAFATSGPGATNLMTGICHAYFDSIPVIFITGQVNTYESKGSLSVRQKGFQETDIVSMVSGVTKEAVYVESAENFPELFYNLYSLSLTGRKGPVLLDIPMNIQRAEIEESIAEKYIRKDICIAADQDDFQENKLKDLLKKSKRPLIIVGAGIKQSGGVELFRKCLENINIPVVTSMIAFDILPKDHTHNFGFIGTYGNRAANFMISKADLIIAIGSRLDCRQTGSDPQKFAPKAILVRVDIDQGEMTNKIKSDEIQYCMDGNLFTQRLEKIILSNNEILQDYHDWWETCFHLKNVLKNVDDLKSNRWIEELSKYFPENSIITTDVGQNQVWVAQSMKNKSTHKVFFSGGHGAMGYSLPAAIGAYYYFEKQKIISISGDGGLQMNLQELEFVRRENLPIKIILINNYSLGMIRHFQEMYFDASFSQTVAEKGYTVPDFSKIARAYDVNYTKLTTITEMENIKYVFYDDNPQFIEIDMLENTYVYPKLSVNKSIEDQEPPLDRELFDTLARL